MLLIHGGCWKGNMKWEANRSYEVIESVKENSLIDFVEMQCLDVKPKE